MIPRSLPFERDKITVANKTGWDEEKLPDARGFKGDVRTDAAYVKSPKARYVIAICARKVRDKSPGVDNQALVIGRGCRGWCTTTSTRPAPADRRSSPGEVSELKNPQARHCRQVAIVRQKNRTPA